MKKPTANANAPDVTNGTIKDPADWTTGDEPMTGAQESYLHTLARQAGREEEIDEELTKAEASEMIDDLRQETGKEEVPAATPKSNRGTKKPKAAKARTSDRTT